MARGSDVGTAARPRRFAEAFAFVGAWMALGYAIRPDPNTYLVLGVPLTVIFQLFIRWGRLEDLWVRGGRPFARPWPARVVTVALLVAVVLIAVSRWHVGFALWIGSALVGVVGAIYALRHARRATFIEGAKCLATAGTMRMVTLIVATLVSTMSHRSVGERVTVGLVYLPLYFFVTFVLEEVTFRGLIDSHVHHAGESGGLLSAAAVSTLWAIWHLPIADGPAKTVLWQLLVVHVPVGTALSIFWRRSGNLAVPAFTHAVIDAVRNALFV